MIQDYILSIIGILFSISLIPMIITVVKTKITKNLSMISLIVTSFGLLTMAFTFLTMKCYFTFIVNLLTSLSWFILLFLKIKYFKKGVN